jgi:beta-galactosidase
LQIAGLTFGEGGPVLGIQCENEFMDSVAPWETTHNTAMTYTPKGADGIKHMRTLKRIAVAAGLDVPLHVSTGWGGSPVDARELLPMYGGYGYYAWLDDPTIQEPTGFFLFRDLHGRQNGKFNASDVPYACCEIGGGMQPFYRNRPAVPPESVEAMHIAQLGSGSNVMGYYVYHGGINPVGKHSYFNEHRCPRISYDFQAPLGEFGQIRAHYGLLRRQFLFLQAFGDRLAPMEVELSDKVASMSQTDTETVRFGVRARENSGFLFLNNFQDHVELPERKDLRVEITTQSGEKATFPAGSKGLTLRSGAVATLPFHFDMDGILLKSATVQPLTRIEHDGNAHYFFFAPDGFPPEYVFDTATCAELELRKARKRKDGDTTIVTPNPGTESLLTFPREKRGRVLVWTLTESQSRSFWKAKVAGQERVFLSEAGLMFSRSSIEIYGTDPSGLAFDVYPPLHRNDGATFGFETHVARTRAKEIKLRVRKLGPDKVSIRVPANALSGLHEVMLRIDYTGDTGSAYLDGKLIHDNFWNGKVWEIGIRSFAPRILETELVLVLTPLRKAGAKVEYSSMAAMQVVEDAAPMEFHSITAAAVHKQRIDFANRRVAKR